MNEEKLELTDNEKYECVVRWLNALNHLWLKMYLHGDGPLLKEYAQEECSVLGARYKPNCYPCSMCGIWQKKCKIRNKLPSENWKILEQFVGKDTIGSEGISTGE